MDDTREILWQNCYGGSAWEMGFDIIEDNGGYTFIGLTESNDGDVSYNHGEKEQTDLWLVHIDDTGNLLWEKTLGVLIVIMDTKYIKLKVMDIY